MMTFLLIDILDSNIFIVSFKTKELAKQAIKILGKETLKLIFCNDY